MKLCKNNFDIRFANCIYCQKCSFQMIGYECKWFDIVGNNTPGCGGVKSHTLSDIFTL